MRRLFPSLLIFSAVSVAAAVTWHIFFGRPVTHLESRLSKDDPVAVRLSLLNENDSDALEYLAQMIIYPEQKYIVFYFLNTDAKLESDGKPVRLLSPNAADRFQEYTGLRSDFTISLNVGSAVKLIDLIGGIKHFQEKPLVFSGSKYQYPAGIIYMHGLHALEYLLYRRNEPDPASQHLTGVDRIYRAQSLLLNSVWRIQSYYSKIQDEALWNFATGLVKTDLTADELKSLAAFLYDPDLRASVAEVPLQETDGGKDRFGRPLKALVVSPGRARSYFEQKTSGIKDKSLFKSAFNTDIQNGTETPGLARRVGQYITGQDIRVLSINNYEPKPLEESLIIDRSGNTVFSSRLLKLISLDHERLYVVRTPSDVDTTLLLGNDFNIKSLKH